MSFLLYLILFIALYRIFVKYISSNQIKEKKSKNGLKYQDAEFRDID
tara:strand:- start:535 stop:675 length:141 start_codon:yes stop_codon:yes gene_type:complete